MSSVYIRWGGIFDLSELNRRLDELNYRSQAETFWDDPARAQQVLQERASVEESIKDFEGAQKSLSAMKDLIELVASEKDEAMAAEVAGELDRVETALRRMELARMLSAPEDKLNAIVTIHPGAGGVEANDWAEMLMRMYLRWCERRGFKTEMVNLQPGEEAGIKDATFVVSGLNAYGFLRAENGVHRLIRISPYDANARRHTSFAAVFVVPEFEEDSTEIEIKPEDLKVDTFRAGGKGGQHVNKTESAIRITHIPTGIVVQCQAERSQHKNRSTAMKMLRGHLYEKARQEREAAFTENYASNKLEINFGSQVRTYTMAPYQLVKDERTDVRTSDVGRVLDGDLDEFIEAALLLAASESKTAQQGENDATPSRNPV